MAPREEQYNEMQRILGYFKKFPKGHITMDPIYIDWSEFDNETNEDWSELYPDAEEELPPNMPPPQGRTVQVKCYMLYGCRSCK